MVYAPPALGLTEQLQLRAKSKKTKLESAVPDEKALVISVVGVPEVGMVGMNVLWVVG